MTRQLARFPETVRLDGCCVPVEFGSPRASRTTARLCEVPLLALPESTRAGARCRDSRLVGPRIVALLRSLPKEARRRLIPIADAAAEFLSSKGAPCADLDRSSA